ncbi:hypothetical protein Pint_11081 [Pistacia integerrima]|uniref:Uncharacterized protein n=1 Tax=Pistacia integerrima TaxID=434235 RepID=A0ACC0XH48_9ROSI|nr:hypothetical protein Pint_11081 [Pistacia integerrima]
MGISIFDLDGETSLAPFEMVSLMIEALAWCSVVVMIGLETKIYVREFRWYVRFGVIYVLIGDAVVLNLILPMMDYYNSYTVIVLNGLCTEVLFGILLFAYVPNLQSHPGYNLLQDESLDNVEYEALPGGEHVCPERSASILSRGNSRHLWPDCHWSTFVIQRALIFRFQKCWVKESQRAKPWLLRALNSSLGGRFWLGGFFKIVYDLSQFVVPVLLNHLLQPMQRGDPAWIGYVYAFLIFIGVFVYSLLTILFHLDQSIGVLCEAHFFQNVWRVGFRLRSTLVAAIFHKSLRLTHESRKNFPSGKITNMITTDATALQHGSILKSLVASSKLVPAAFTVNGLLRRQLGCRSFRDLLWRPLFITADLRRNPSSSLLILIEARTARRSDLGSRTHSSSHCLNLTQLFIVAMFTAELHLPDGQRTAAHLHQ